MFNFLLKAGLVLFIVSLCIAGAAASLAVPSALVAGIPVLLLATPPLTSFLSVWLPLSVIFGIIFAAGFIADVLSDA